MYVCMYIHIYTYIYNRICLYVYTRTQVQQHALTYADVC